MESHPHNKTEVLEVGMLYLRSLVLFKSWHTARAHLYELGRKGWLVHLAAGWAKSSHRSEGEQHYTIHVRPLSQDSLERLRGLRYDIITAGTDTAFTPEQRQFIKVNLLAEGGKLNG